MKLALTWGRRFRLPTADTIEILSPAPACRFQLGDAPPRDANVETPEPGVYSVLLEGRSYDAFVEDTPTGLVVTIEGYRFEIEARDPRRWFRKTAGAGADRVQSILSPMPGKVIRVLVAPGDPVVPGQGIVVVEAMKMQNELKSNRTGRVLAVPAKEGATVTAGELLATIE
jgi:acetyl/propionyl-CoA carboxylase alpha subunit